MLVWKSRIQPDSPYSTSEVLPKPTFATRLQARRALAGSLWRGASNKCEVCRLEVNRIRRYYLGAWDAKRPPDIVA